MARDKRIPGLHEYRFKSNPHERVAAEHWERQKETLCHLLGDGTSVGRVTPSDREYEVAATLMQWLGSPVGRSWLAVLNRMFDEVVEDEL